MTGGDDSDLDANHEMYFGKRPTRRAAKNISEEQAVEQALNALYSLAAITSDTDIRRLAQLTMQDLEYFEGQRKNKARYPAEMTAALRRQAEIKKKAEIEMHTAPDMLPPRQDMRSRVDKDLKAEQEADMNTDDLYKKMAAARAYADTLK